MEGHPTVPIAIVIIIAAILIPLPTIVLDLLISTNIALSVVILLSAAYILKPVQFSVLPQKLLSSIVPPVNVSDNLKPGSKEYTILLKGVEMSRGELQVDRLLAINLRERVSIRDLITVFETPANYGSQTRGPVTLAEMTRAALCRSITRGLVNEKGELPVITLSREWESRLSASLTRSVGGTYPGTDAKSFKRLAQSLTDACQKLSISSATLLCPSTLRFHARKLLERFIPQMTVIFPNDIPPNLQIVSIGVVSQ